MANGTVAVVLVIVLYAGSSCKISAGFVVAFVFALHVVQPFVSMYSKVILYFLECI